MSEIKRGQNARKVLLRRAAVSFLFGCVMMAAVCWACAALIAGKGLSQSILPVAATGCICAACVANGWLLARLQGKNGLACGCLTFALWFLLLCVWNGILGNTSFGSFAVLRAVSMLIAAVCSSFAGMLCAENAGRRKMR